MKLSTPKLKTFCDNALLADPNANGPTDKFWHDVDPNGQHEVLLAFVHEPGLIHAVHSIRAFLECAMQNGKTPLVCDFTPKDAGYLVRRGRQASRRRRVRCRV